MIDASLNEVESMAAKAARGAGLAWGLAEEIGKAARWLAGCGIDWAPSLVALLDGDRALAMPVAGSPGAVASSRPGALLSPLATGAYLHDIARLAGTVEIAATAHPLWLLPFAGRSAADTAAPVVVGWGGISIAAWPSGGDVSGDVDALHTAQAVQVRWTHAVPGVTLAAPVTTFPRVGRSDIRGSDWQALERLGARTYVPASALSRARGAGAGTTDND